MAYNFYQVAKGTYGDRFTYENVNYINSNTEISITCPKHGDFTKKPQKFLHAGQYCSKCKAEEREKQKELEYLNIFQAKFKGKFTYKYDKFQRIYDKLTVVCPQHGEHHTTFEQHSISKYGCPKCGIKAAAKAKEKTIDDFITKASEVHDGYYSYENSIYLSAKQKITITCPVHGDFDQLVSGHLAGYGCSKCASYGKGRVDMNKPCKLYYLNIKGTSLYKLGITTRSIEERYRLSFDRDQFNIVFIKKYHTGREAYNAEQSLFAEFKHLLYSVDKVLSSGNTELFTEDIFKGNYDEYTT